MFRRRPFRRPPLFAPRPPLPPRGVPPPPIPPLPLVARQALARANALMAGGQFAEAASIFERLSDEAQRRSMPIRAADLALQSARAHFAAGTVEAALERAKQALRLFVAGGRPGRVPTVLSKMTAALRQQGYDSQADQLQQEAERLLGESGFSLDELRQSVQVAERRGTLPARCEGCGAPLVPDEVEWHDACTAECPYCGTIAKTA